jgi:hypothetical protein
MGICSDKAKEIVDQLRIDDDKNSLVYKAAVVIVYGMANNTVNITRIKQATGYTYTQVIKIMGNLEREVKIYRRKWNVPIVEDEFRNVVEIALSAMVGGGELVYVAPDDEEVDVHETEVQYPYLKIA